MERSLFLFINSITVFIKPFENSTEKCELVLLFSFHRKVPKDRRSQFLANLLIIELFQKRLKFFAYFQETPILMNTI